jgi:O-antigen/teichoic acid export membrane protein
MSVFQSIKRLLKHSAVYGIGHIVTRSIGFLLLPLYTNVLPPEDFGVAGLLFTYIAICMIFFTYGMDAAMLRFYILEEEEQGQKRVFTTALVMIMVTSVVFSAILLLGAEEIANLLFSYQVRQLEVDLPFLIRLGGGILFFDAMTLPAFLTLRAKERSGAFTAFKLFNILINVGANVLFLIIWDYGVEGIFIANLVASATTFVLLLPMIVKNITFSFSRQTFRELLAFGLPYLPSTLSVVLMDTIDRVFLERLASVEEVGVYNAGARLGMFMALFVAAFRFAWHPYFLATSKQENAKAIFAKIFTYVLFACLAVFLLISFFIDDIVQFKIFGKSLIGAEFWQCTVVVPVILLAYVLYAAYLNFLIGIYLEKKTKYLPYITVAGMLGNLAANYLLIPQIGMMGAAWARLVAYVIMAVALYWVAHRLYQVNYEWGRIIKLGVVVAIIFLIGQIAVVDNNFVFKTGVLLLFPVLLFASGFFVKEELSVLKQITRGFVPGSAKRTDV